MDHPHWSALTDNIVVVQPRHRRLLWVPRDLWCPVLQDRVNGAYWRGGHTALTSALAEHGIAVEHSICLTRAATERSITGLSVSVPVQRKLEFWYPIDRASGLEAGRTPVDFHPPWEVLSGDRVHQWLGARYERGSGGASDLARIGRQQVFLRALIAQGFDFRPVIADPSRARVSSPEAIAEASQVRGDWTFGLVPRLTAARVGDQQVLVMRRRSQRVRTLVSQIVRRSARPRVSAGRGGHRNTSARHGPDT